MKKLLGLVVVLICLLTLSACSDVNIPENPSADFPADYLSDSSVLIISEKADIDENTIKTHYDNGGIILVKNWELASEVQSFIATTVSTEFNEEDRAIIFYLDAKGIPGTSIVGGNSTNLDIEIDEMIDEAKTKQ